MGKNNKKKFKDYNREGLSFQKIIQLGRLFVPKNNRAIAKVDHFSNISIKKVNEILGTNFKGVILDIDDCVAYHRGKIKEKNIPAIIKPLIS